MNNTVAHLLNDRATDRLADIYLSFINIPTTDRTYRFIKKAVILSLRIDDMQAVYAELEKSESCAAEQIKSGIAKAISDLPQPIEDIFNAAYCPESEHGFMPKFKSADDIIAFLGKAFLYILETNYK
ncbi:MAG: hypothetical protein K2F90_00470 [Clostridiales bacterium]|nr:hypothetical protein [Clostridiales bacterium]